MKEKELHIHKDLFLQQSYLDAYDEYILSLKKDNYPVWDYIVLTASNEAQAAAYRQQIDFRLKKNKLPAKTKYVVLADPDGKRVGSGGATLNVMKHIRESHESFADLKILVIHSGGDSKRVPQYSACGKLFSPIPRELLDGRRSTLFDEFIISMTGVPARISNSMLICSGDVMLLFNPLQIDFYSKGAAAISIKENVETGKNHGVHLGDKVGNVGRFLHKLPVETLEKYGAIDAHQNVDIDTGAVILGSSIIDDVYKLIDTKDKFDKFVNEKVRLSFYADFLYPLASKSELEAYLLETPEGDFSDELTECRTLLWDVMSPYNMKMIRFAPASFIHFGTTRELLNLVTHEIADYVYLNWSNNVCTNSKDKNYAASNSYISHKAKIGNDSYIEDSYIDDDVTVGNGCIISGVTLKKASVQDNTVIHGLKLNDGKFVVRTYAVTDNPKENKWFGKDIGQPLWTADVFNAYDTMQEAVSTAISLKVEAGAMSLMDSFNNADTYAIMQWQTKLNDEIKAMTLIESIDNRVDVDGAIKIFENGISNYSKEILLKEADKLSIENLEEFLRKIRLYFYLSKLSEDKEGERLMDLCFKTISNAVIKASIKDINYNESYKISKEEVVIKLPVRVNYGGGWSDTPPHCLEKGGTVINAAITINGECPVEVVVRKIDGDKIILASNDNGSYQEFTDIKHLQDCSNPHDVFALHKATLIGCGIIPYTENISLEEITKRLGGGLYLSTQVKNIPRGSGLGTSSILSGACVKAVYEFLGTKINDSDLYNSVLCVEQIMSTGGGWQDQVGGIAKGIKMIKTRPGLYQDINCLSVNISKETIDELNSRFCVLYTGQRRLARNLLRKIMGKFIACDSETMQVLYEIQQYAALMQFELERENVDGFAKLMTEHWELSKRLDSGCTNTCIDHIFSSIDDLIDGKMICGAGGGGFLQIVVKKGITIEKLRQRIDLVFSDSGVEVWDCELFI